MTGTMGVHLLANIFGCPVEVLNYEADVARLLNEVVVDAKLTKVSESHFQFDPVGVTSVILLAESHISIHTWPEHGSAAVDIFCCSGEKAANRAFKALLERFKPEKHDCQIIKR
jgi:S-adenosylmethionine decarboxylase